MILTSWEEKGIKKGRKEGIEKGMEKGIEKGIEKGMEKGILIAKKLLKMGIDIHSIKEATGLSESEINKLKSNRK